MSKFKFASEAIKNAAMVAASFGPGISIIGINCFFSFKNGKLKEENKGLLKQLEAQQVKAKL